MKPTATTVFHAIITAEKFVFCGFRGETSEANGKQYPLPIEEITAHIAVVVEEEEHGVVRLSCILPSFHLESFPTSSDQ